MQTLKTQLNAREKGTQRRKLRTSEPFLTGPKAMEMFAAQEREEAEKMQLEQRKKQERSDKEAARENQRSELARQGEGVRFTKSLSSCKKGELEDIAYILGLKLDPKDTVKHILAKINTRFDSMPAMKTDPRFRGIFESTRSSRRVLADENTAPVAGPSNLRLNMSSQSPMGHHSSPSVACNPLGSHGTDLRYHPYPYILRYERGKY
ncbi:hypothetical protein EW026_g7745 [Hermanssonia centrifuga]|uniref:Uncharacterized protein n=1 Tax=Hermanssonia centrifuga TaxID=98765 RepID=A0A4S4K6S5_9APHY|nr:hypothetical protein EW026_g7745 [Hermanssonia centrifuga]